MIKICKEAFHSESLQERFKFSVPAFLKLFILAFFISGTDVRAYSLYLKNVAVLKNGNVYIKDIARVDGEELPGRISSQKIFQSETGPRYVSRSDVLTVLAQLPEKMHQVYGRGVWILPLTKKIQGQELSSMLLKEIQKIPAASKVKNSLVLRLDPDAEIECFENCKIDFNLPSDLDRLFAGKRVVSADITSELRGKKVILHRQRFVISVLKKIEVPVAARDLEIGMRITDADFRMEERELDPDEINHAEGKLTGRRVLAAVQKDQILRNSSVQFQPTVRRGQSLEVVFQTENIVLKMKSFAGSDGEIGDIIPVRLLLPSGNKSDIKKVRVVSENVAVLE